MIARPFPPALLHGDLAEVLPDLFFVTGAVYLPGPLPVRFSRNMVVVREGARLVLVNSVRLDDRGLEALDRLGKVTDVIRVAGNHGMDDPFYADRYGAKVWAIKGQRYTGGFDTEAEPYFSPHVEVGPETELPLAGARVHIIESRPIEALLLLPQHGGVAVSGDCLQNWATSDPRFNWLAKLMMPVMGFIRPHNVGPAWYRQCKPPHAQLGAILDLPFSNVLPGHGSPVLGQAIERYRPVIERLVRAR